MIPGHNLPALWTGFPPPVWPISQLNLFDEVQPRPHSDALMKVLDGINHSGMGKIWFAGRGIAPEWQMKREMLSPAYTTRWSDLPVARL